MFSKITYDGKDYLIPEIQYGVASKNQNFISTVDMHEYGHTFKFAHTGIIACSGVQPQAPYSGCSVDDGMLKSHSPLSLMSSVGYYGRHYVAFEKEMAGFFVDTTNLSVSNNDYYILDLNYNTPIKVRVNGLKSISSQVKGVKAVKIYSLDKRIFPLYIETRDGSGTYEKEESSLPDSLYDYNGLLVSMPRDSGWGRTSLLLDLDPATNRYSLSPGQSYVDTARGIKLSNVQYSKTTGMSFDVELIQPNFDLIKQSAIPGIWHPVYTIDSFTGPSVVKLGEVGTWNIRLKETILPSQVVNNVSYPYSMDWGDGISDGGIINNAILQTSHVYQTNGRFSPKITVTWGENSAYFQDIKSAQATPVYVASISPIDVSSDNKVASVTIKGVPCGTRIDWEAPWGISTSLLKSCSKDGLVVEEVASTSIPLATINPGKYTITATTRDGNLSSPGQVVVNPQSITGFKATETGGVTKFSWTASNPGGMYQMVVDDGAVFADNQMNADQMISMLGGMNITPNDTFACQAKSGVFSEWNACAVAVSAATASFSVLPEKGKYIVYIRAVGPNKDVASGWYTYTSILTPTNFASSNRTDSSVTLSWAQSGVNQPSLYKIFRSYSASELVDYFTDNSAFTIYPCNPSVWALCAVRNAEGSNSTDISGTSTSIVDTTADSDSGATYFYRIRAIKSPGNGKSGLSNQVTVSPLPVLPPSVTPIVSFNFTNSQDATKMFATSTVDNKPFSMVAGVSPVIEAGLSGAPDKAIRNGCLDVTKLWTPVGAAAAPNYQSITVSAWVKRPTTNQGTVTLFVSDGSYQALIQADGSVAVRTKAGRDCYGSWDDAAGNAGWFKTIPGVVGTGAYYHVVWTKEAGTGTGATGKMAVYVNGVKAVLATGVSDVRMGAISTNCVTALGATFGARKAGCYANGSVDNLKIYDRALSAADALALYKFEKSITQ